MRGAWPIALRELSAYFRQPAGWIILALYLFLSGLVFATGILMPGKAASLRDFFALSGWLLLPVAPAITMRLVAEELRAGTIENLFTAPLSSAAIVLGKYFGACLFLLAMLAPTLVYPVVLRSFSSPQPDVGPMIAGYLCLLLLGGLYLALGTFASTLTANGTLAFLISLFSILALMFAGSAPPTTPASIRAVLDSVWITARVLDFSRGIIDTSHVVFFVTASAWFVFLSIVSLEVRRWR